MIGAAEFNVARMEAACSGGFLEATDAAEYLVRKGLPFRLAHEAAAGVVRDCLAAGQKGIADRTLTELKDRSPLFDADIYEALKPSVCVAARNLPGGPAPEEVLRQIQEMRRRFE
jgi:argininosuccinate lyase